MITKKKIFYLVLFLVSLCTQIAAQGGILGIGGFVRESDKIRQSSRDGAVQVDYSVIRVELTTSDGVKLHDTECAPNGYYFLPISQSDIQSGRQLKIRAVGPSGWVLYPEQVPVTCTESECANGEDVNFEFSGFAISGRIESGEGTKTCKEKSDLKGISGVKINLLDSDSKILQTTASKSPKGQFLFSDVAPGEYIVKIDDSQKRNFETNQQKIEVKSGTAKLSEIFTARGYEVSGSVSSEGVPIGGMQITLFSNDINLLEGCDSVQNAGDVKYAQFGTGICTVSSNSEGIYKFSNVPCGLYTLVAYYPSTSLEFEVTPDHIDIYIGYENLKVQQEFSIAGFGISGQVVDTQGQAVPNASIEINGKKITETDNQGLYFLQKMKTGKYDIHAFKQNHKFKNLNQVQISPGSGQLPVITVESYSVCGRIILEKKQFQVEKRTITLTGDAQPPSRTQTNKFGEFCFFAADGDYEITPIINKNEGGLNFYPPSLKISVKSKPILNIEFSQIKLKAKTQILCKKQECADDVEVQLQSNFLNLKFPVNDPPLNVNVKFEKFQIGFEFSDLSPGNYEFKAEQKGWCWGNDKIEFQLSSTEDSEFIFDGGNLVQTGFIQEILVQNIDVTFNVQCPKLKPVIYEFSPNSEKYVECFPTDDKCVIKDETECFSFVQSDEEEIEFQAGFGNLLKLTPKRTKFTGIIQTPENWSGKPGIAKVYSESLQKEFELVGAPSGLPDTPPHHLYFSQWLPLMDIIHVTAQHETLVVSPLSGHKLQIQNSGDQFKCSDLIYLQAMEGVMIQGQVSPSMDNANITLKYIQEPKFSQEAELEQRLSDKAGKFSFGPFLPTVQFEAQVEKIGYVFDEPVIDQDAYTIQIRGHKLASIVVKVKMGGSVEGSSDVLLSLTGPNQYRSNVQTNKDGTWTFYDLLSGQYYLRPFIKEWTFDPATKTIDLKDGEEKVVKFVGTRSQYSIFGTIKTLNGLGISDVVARAENEESGIIETGVTNQDGNFRIKGLNANDEYVINLQLKNDLERHAPNNYRIKMMNRDLKDINFTVLHYAPNAALTGTIQISDESIQNFKISITKFSNQDREQVEFVKTFEIDYSRWFEISNLKAGSYRVGLECDLPKTQFVCDSNFFDVQFDGKRDLFVGELEGGVGAKGFEGGVEGGLGSVFGSVVVAGGVMAIVVFVMWDLLKDNKKKVESKKEGGQWLPAKAAKELSRKME